MHLLLYVLKLSLSYLLSLLSTLIFSDMASITPISFILSVLLPTHCSHSHTVYPWHGIISSITAPSASSDRWRINAALFQVPQRIRMLDLTFANGILATTKLQISEYSCFFLKLISAANLLCSAKTSTSGILSTEYTTGLKVRLRSRKALRCFSFFYFSAFERAFLIIIGR